MCGKVMILDALELVACLGIGLVANAVLDAPQFPSVLNSAICAAIGLLVYGAFQLLRKGTWLRWGAVFLSVVAPLLVIGPAQPYVTAALLSAGFLTAVRASSWAIHVIWWTIEAVRFPSVQHRHPNMSWMLAFLGFLGLLALGGNEPETEERHVIAAYVAEEYVTTVRVGRSEKVWVYRSDRLLGVVNGHNAQIRHAVFVRNGLDLKTVDRSGRTLVTDLDRLNALPVLGLDNPFLALIRDKISLPAFVVVKGSVSTVWARIIPPG